jgi:hypothetical protein
MAVGMLQMLQGGTKEQYDQVNEAMFGQSRPSSDQVPEGLIIHSAGPAEGGWYIYDIWESREAFERFMDGQLGAAPKTGSAPATTCCFGLKRRSPPKTSGRRHSSQSTPPMLRPRREWSKRSLPSAGWPLILVNPVKASPRPRVLSPMPRTTTARPDLHLALNRRYDVGA